jgi:hypothetical protein
MSKTYEIYIAEKPYQALELGSDWRKHRFFMLADNTKESFAQAVTGHFIPEQELHYLRIKPTGLLKARVCPINLIQRPVSEITLLGPVKSGNEYTIRGDWNRALTAAVELNKFDLFLLIIKHHRTLVR